MAKVTSKLQVTIPKVIADEYGIEPGDAIEFEAAGDVIRVRPARRQRRVCLSREERLRLFDDATARQQQREKTMRVPVDPATERGWTREELYARGESD